MKIVEIFQEGAKAIIEELKEVAVYVGMSIFLVVFCFTPVTLYLFVDTEGCSVSVWWYVLATIIAIICSILFVGWFKKRFC